MEEELKVPKIAYINSLYLLQKEFVLLSFEFGN